MFVFCQSLKHQNQQIRDNYVQWYENKYENANHIIPEPPHLPPIPEMTKVQKNEKKQSLMINEARNKLQIECQVLGDSEDNKTEIIQSEDEQEIDHVDDLQSQAFELSQLTTKLFPTYMKSVQKFENIFLS